MKEKIEMMKWHVDEEIKLRGEYAIKIFRKFYGYYLRGFDGVAKLRGQLVIAESYDEIMDLLDKIE